MFKALLGAVQFLTILPVGRSTAEPGRAALFFPLVGAWLGLLAGSLLSISASVFPIQLAALVAVAALILLTGSLHEDGLADVADAFRAGRPPERILSILKDSRVGAYGAVAILLSVLIRWQAAASLAVPAAAAFAAALSLSRASMVVLAWLARPAGQGVGFFFSRTLTTPVAAAAALQGIAFSFLSGVDFAITLLAGAAVIIIALRSYFEARLGGVTGDCLGAASQLVEIFAFAVLACRNCTS